MTETSQANQPVHKVKKGAVVAAVWQNQGSEGPFFSTTLARVFKGKDGFRETSSFGVRHLPLVKEALSEVESWIKAKEKAPSGGEVS